MSSVFLSGQSDSSSLAKFKIRSDSDSICPCDSIRYEIEGDAAVEVLMKDSFTAEHLKLPYVIRFYYRGSRNLLRCISGTGPRALIEKLPRGIYDIDILVQGYYKPGKTTVTLSANAFVSFSLLKNSDK